MPVMAVALMLREKASTQQSAGWAFHPRYTDWRYRNPFVFARQTQSLTRTIRFALLPFCLQVYYRHVF